MATARKRTAPATGPRSTAKAKKQAEAEAPGIIVDGTKYELGDLELRELAELEDFTGSPMDEIHYGSAKTIAFVVFLVRRRNDANYTLDDALSIKVDRLGGEGGENIKVDGGEPGPTPATG